MLNRRHLRQFLALVDTGSFTAAANQLHVAQPTLSAGIAELERALGAAVSRAAAPTPHMEKARKVRPVRPIMGFLHRRQLFDGLVCHNNHVLQTASQLII